MTRTPVPANTLPKTFAELPVPVPDQHLEPSARASCLIKQIARLLRRPVTGWMSRDTEDVHTPRLDLHDEQRVQVLEPDSVETQDVARQDARRLRGRELAPAQ